MEKVGREHVARLTHALRDRPYMVNRVLETGSKLFNLAEEWELRSGANPCRFVKGCGPDGGRKPLA